MTYATHYETRLETLPREEIELMQETLLLQLAPYVYARSAIVREAWDMVGLSPRDITNLADFQSKVPFLNKDNIRQYRDQHNDPYGGLKCVEAPHLRIVGSTSGTTGDPTPVPFFRSSQVPQMKRDLWHIGMRPGDYMTMNVFTYREGHAALDYSDCGFRPITFQHSPEEIPRIIEASEIYRPKVLFITSGPMMMAMEAYVREHNVDIENVFSSYKGWVFGGEAPSPRLRKLAQSWGIELFEITSLGDVTGAIECSAHDGFHTWEDLAYVECLEPDGSVPVADGEMGELVVTSLYDDVAPLVRFRTDDLVTFTRKPCLCGRTHGRIKVMGRKGDLMDIAGTFILPKDITPIIESQVETEAGLYQIIRQSMQADVLRLRVGFHPGKIQHSTEELVQRLTNLVGKHLAVPVQVALVENAELLKLGPPHKIPRVAKR